MLGVATRSKIAGIQFPEVDSLHLGATFIWFVGRVFRYCEADIIQGFRASFVSV